MKNKRFWFVIANIFCTVLWSVWSYFIPATYQNLKIFAACLAALYFFKILEIKE